MITLCHIFPKKLGWQKNIEKINFWCFLKFFRCVLFCWQWISRNCINVYFLCKFDNNRIKIDNLTHKNLSIFIKQKIFEKSFFAIENFKSGKLWIFLHFEKHQKMRNWIFQLLMFFVFSFFHFPCKIKILNDHGSHAFFKQISPCLSSWLW